MIGLSALLAGALILFATRPGIGLGSDSFYYLGGAEFVDRGEGFSRPTGDGGSQPITHFPPLYSYLLTLGGDAIREYQEAARLLNALLFSLSAFGFGLGLYLTTGSPTLIAVGMLTFSFSSPLISLHSFAFSEPLFLSLLLLHLLLLWGYLKEYKGYFLLLMALSAGMAYLARYAGLALFGTSALSLLLLSERGGGKRVISTLAYLALAALGPALWLSRNLRVAGTATNRQLGWHPPSVDSLVTGLRTVAGWALPNRIPLILRDVASITIFMVLIGLALLFFWRFRRGQPLFRQRRAADFLWVNLIFSIGYLGSVLFSLWVVDFSIPLDDRILFPFYVSGMWMAFLLVHLASQRWSAQPVFRGALLGILGIFLAGSVLRGALRIADISRDPGGFAHPRWTQSEVIQWVREQPEGLLLYTNELDGLYLLTGHPAYLIPIKWDPVKAEVREDYQELLALMRGRLEGEQGALVIFNTLQQQRAFFPSEEELAEGLRPVIQSDLGSVYRP